MFWLDCVILFIISTGKNIKSSQGKHREFKLEKGVGTMERERVSTCLQCPDIVDYVHAITGKRKATDCHCKNPLLITSKCPRNFGIKIYFTGSVFARCN